MKHPLSYHPQLLASKGQRFANFIIDFIFRFVLAFVFGIIAALLTYVGFDGLYNWIQELDELGNLFFEFGLVLFYFLIMETLTQRTVGKLITGTKVVMEDGSKPGAGTIVARTLCRIIPFDAFSFFGDPSRGWHDSISNTYVIDVKKYKAAEELENSFEEIGSEISDITGS